MSEFINEEIKEESKNSFLKYCVETESGDIYAETVVLGKDDMVAVLNAIATPNFGIVVQLDPRNSEPNIQGFDGINTIKQVIKQSVETSIERGWKVLKRGKPKWSW